MLAPVLARLQTIAGVGSARADASGRHFWLELDERADATAVAERARAVLGAGAIALPAPQAEAQLAARGQGDPWLSAGEVMTLSFVEARLLSVRISGEVQGRTGATPEQREAIAEAIRVELFSAMARVHAEGGRGSSGWIYAAWPALAAAAVVRCAPALPPELAAGLAELLPALLSR